MSAELREAVDQLKAAVEPHLLRRSFWIGVVIIAVVMAAATALLGIDAGR